MSAANLERAARDVSFPATPDERIIGVLGELPGREYRNAAELTMAFQEAIGNEEEAGGLMGFGAAGVGDGIHRGETPALEFFKARLYTLRPLIASGVSMPVSRILPVLAVAAALAPLSSAQADSELRDRYIAASQQMGEGMLKVVQACAPQIDMSEIDFDYTPRMVEAVSCVVDTHIDRFGRAETVALVEEAEAMGERSFSSLQEMTTMQQDYPRLSDPAMLEINQTCGTIEASRDLPLTSLMQENMAQMAACFSE